MQVRRNKTTYSNKQKNKLSEIEETSKQVQLGCDDSYISF